MTATTQKADSFGNGVSAQRRTVSHVDWCAAFFTDVASGILAGVVAGAVLLLGGYWLIDRKIHILEALARRKDREERDERNRNIALSAIHDELHECGEVPDVHQDAQRGPHHVPLVRHDDAPARLRARSLRDLGKSDRPCAPERPQPA